MNEDTKNEARLPVVAWRCTVDNEHYALFNEKKCRFCRPLWDGIGAEALIAELEKRSAERQEVAIELARLLNEAGKEIRELKAQLQAAPERGCDPAYCADAQARLAEIDTLLATAQPAADGERATQVAFIQSGNGMKPTARIGTPADLYFPGGDASGYEFEPLMTIAQHKRILAALSAKAEGVAVPVPPVQELKE